MVEFLKSVEKVDTVLNGRSVLIYHSMKFGILREFYWFFLVDSNVEYHFDIRDFVILKHDNYIFTLEEVAGVLSQLKGDLISFLVCREVDEIIRFNSINDKFNDSELPF
jgi:hypothetical protein